MQPGKKTIQSIIARLRPVSFRSIIDCSHDVTIYTIAISGKAAARICMIPVLFVNSSFHFAEIEDGIVWTNPTEDTKRTGLLVFAWNFTYVLYCIVATCTHGKYFNISLYSTHRSDFLSFLLYIGTQKYPCFLFSKKKY